MRKPPRPSRSEWARREQSDPAGIFPFPLIEFSTNLESSCPIDELRRAVHLIGELRFWKIAKLIQIGPRPPASRMIQILPASAVGAAARAGGLVLVHIKRDHRVTLSGVTPGSRIGPMPCLRPEWRQGGTGPRARAWRGACREIRHVFATLTAGERRSSSSNQTVQTEYELVLLYLIAQSHECTVLMTLGGSISRSLFSGHSLKYELLNIAPPLGKGRC
jgi:hypothetical protein